MQGALVIVRLHLSAASLKPGGGEQCEEERVNERGKEELPVAQKIRNMK